MSVTCSGMHSVKFLPLPLLARFLERRKISIRLQCTALPDAPYLSSSKQLKQSLLRRLLSKRCERPAVLNRWRARIDSRITSSSAGMLENFVADQGPARPTHPSMTTVLCGVQQAGLRAEDPQVDKRLPCRRRMASKDGVILPAPTVKQLACRDSVGSLRGGEQSSSNPKYLAVRFGLGGFRQTVVVLPQANIRGAASGLRESALAYL